MSARSWRWIGGVVLAVLLAVLVPQLDGGAGDPGPTSARDTAVSTDRSGSSDDAAGSASVDPDSGLPYVDAADLPREAGQVLDAIDAGGPFAYPGKDGSTFGNFEGLLPDRPRGSYREYTVRTPGEGDRGARRIVTEGDPADVLYWTDDHYDSFSVVRR